jgi:phospholipid transport system transporter-binding protein
VVQQDEDIISLDGPVTFETTPQLLGRIKSLIDAGASTLTFRGITEVDSSALGLILACRREAMRHGHEIRFADLPANLTALAALYGISDLIVSQ